MSLGKYWEKSRLEKIKDALRKGAPISTAAHAAGIPGKTLKAWFKQGELGDLESADPDEIAVNVFWQECVQIVAAVQIDCIDVFKKGSRSGIDWRAMESYLARVNPDEWSTKQTVEHAGELAVVDAKAAQRAIQEQFGKIGRKDDTDEPG